MADMKSISSNYRFLIVSVVLLILIIFLDFYFPIVSDSVFIKHGFRLSEYYSLISITILAIISAMIGSEYGKMLSESAGSHIIPLSSYFSEIKENLLFLRVLMTTVICFILIIICILLLKPVPSQGWLRSLYIAIMLSIQSTYICVVYIRTEEQKKARFTFSWLTRISLIAMPVGLLLHHPWNYFAFFSPYYWIAWSWMIGSPTESFIYGFIALLLTSIFLMILLRQFSEKKHL